MNTLRIAFVPGVIAGALAIFTSWFWMAVVFHRHQRATPATWRRETGGHHALASGVQFIAALAIATLYVLVTRDHAGVFADGLRGALRFAALSWIALSAPVALEAAIYVNLAPMVVVGQLINWLTTSVLACAITACWTRAA